IPKLPFELAPETDGDQVQVRMWMDDGTNIAVMYEYIRVLDQAVREVVPPDEGVYITNDLRNNFATIELSLKQPSERTLTAMELADRIRNHVQNTIPGAEIQVSAETGLRVLRFLFRGGGGNQNGGGSSLELQLRGHDMQVAEDLVQTIINRIETVPGGVDADASNRERRPQQNIQFDRQRMAELGLSVQDVASAIQTSIGGRRAGVYRIGGEEIDINVRLRPEDRLSVIDL